MYKLFGIFILGSIWFLTFQNTGFNDWYFNLKGGTQIALLLLVFGTQIAFALMIRNDTNTAFDWKD